MQADIYSYMHPAAGVRFNEDFELFAIKFFGLRGKGVVLSDPARHIWQRWLKLASDFSLDVEFDGTPSDGPAPHRLSPIKLSALLAWAIWEQRPVSSLPELTDQQTSWFAAIGIRPDMHNPELALKYPHQMLALHVAEQIFHRHQAGRGGRLTYPKNASPPYSDHHRKNLCIYMGRGVIGPEALYMIFKTMDLFGYVPTAAEFIAIKGMDTRRDRRGDRP